MTEQATEATAPDPDNPTTEEEVTNEETAEKGPDTFPREYVQRLRDESARHRTRAQRADDLAARLHTSLVAATGRLADPTDLAYEETHLDDPDALTAAIDDLLARKPHLASRRVSGDIGQGASAVGDSVDLADLLRQRAG